jgi:diaminopropionate ammonia-lyase
MPQMTSHPDTPTAADDIARQLLALSPQYAATPLLDLRSLATRLGFAQILAKDEGQRMLGSFKSLGGTYAGLRALARFAGKDIAELLDPATRPRLPALICASDGNHGLAVASAARFAGASARIFLHSRVPAVRARRIEMQGAEIVWIDGTYDDAVDAAAKAGRAGAGILIADTTDASDDPVVADVMAGYGVVAAEIRRQVAAAGHQRPTHVFVQAGVGGLACAMGEGLTTWMAPPAGLIVVEPEKSACVAAALEQDRIVRIPGDLETAAEMLSCGEASAPATMVLRRLGARVVTVDEDTLEQAPGVMREHGGPASTASGAAGLAGLLRLAADGGTAGFGLGASSRILIVVTEAALDG